MAQLQDRLDITVEDLEESLGHKKLDVFIKDSEALFVERTRLAISEACNNPGIRAVFISGPTSSGKTTFTMHLADGLSRSGRPAAFLSLDDYYKLSALNFDRDGRPDFETIDTLDLDRANADIKNIMAGEAVCPPRFNFMTRMSEERDPSEAIKLPDNGVLVVEGLHGLNKRVSGNIDDSSCIKIFIMPYGNVFCDTKLMDSNEIRLLRRIVRDYRHRDAHALSTIDYWPMIEKSEEAYYSDYLTSATYHINSFLAYESLIIAPLALHDLKESLSQVQNNTIKPSVFMQKSNTNKPFADLSKALSRARKLVEHLEKIPKCDPSRVPEDSILLEFIGNN
ncbi:MAG: hypothetical protein K6F83_00630 [Clostridiales bacterium]|nr:hypothetical protein [Clostridiales bacterium]